MENEIFITNTELNTQITLLTETLRDKDNALKSLEDSEKRYRRLFESARDGILILDAETGKIADVNPFLIQLLGYSYDEFRGKHIWEFGAFKDIAASKNAFKILQDNEYIRYEDLPLETHDGQPIAVEFVSNVYLVDNTKVIQCNIRDITAHKRATAERKRLLAAIEQTGEAIVMTDAQGNIQFVNPSFERTTGYSGMEIIGQNLRTLQSGEQSEQFYRNIWDTISKGKTWTGRMVNKRKDGTLYTEETTISPVRDPSGQIVNYVGVKRDITEHLLLTAQFQQAQKMESLGMLASGVAHDYNNMLSVILGYTEMAMKKVDQDQPLHSDLTQILKAAIRSSDITRQLLTFARRQAIVPAVLDLNQTVQAMWKMLKQLIGDNIVLVWQPKAGPCSIKIDPVQVDQLLVNLCVNARDAIADIGTVTIGTANETVDEKYCAQHPGIEKGEYVVLSVRDNGCGMDKETIDQIFEPFFTSKVLGHGTGLGLSTVYGIVKQNHGFITVDSEPGSGTTFKIYLPRDKGPAFDIKRNVAGEIPLSRGETVLVVEDETSLLAMIQAILEQLGYRALAASTVTEALDLAAEHANEIQLLLTDVVMPEMNGQDLAQRILALYPGMKILFMSGYTFDVMAHQGLFDQDINFIPKPFAAKDLAVKMREVLQEECI